MTTTSYLLGLSAGVIKFAAKEISPLAVDKLKALFSNRILVVGNKSSGKTSFIDYLKTGILVDKSIPRKRTIDIQKSPSLNIKMGENGQLQATLRTCMEIPGQIDPSLQARETIAINPNGLILMIDLTQPLSDVKNWLDIYCQKLEDEWRRSSSEVRNEQIKSIILILNKVDTISEDDFKQYEKTLKPIIIEKLNHARGNLDREDILVLPCCCVKNSKGNEYINNVIFSMIMRLKAS